MAMTYERIGPKDQWIVDDQGEVTGVRISGKNAELSGIVTSSRNPLTGVINLSAGSNTAMTALKMDLHAGMTTGIQVIGDSTGNDTHEWPYLLSQYLASEYPTHSVNYRLWDDATQDFAAPVAIQTGTAGGRYMECVTGSYPRQTAVASAPHLTGVIDVRLDLTCSDWTPANAFGATILVGEAGGTGSWSWSLSISTVGTIKLWYSVDGTNLLAIGTPNATGIADGARSWIRAVITPDNGSGSMTFAAYKSTDGITWAQVSTTQTATAAVFFDQIGSNSGKYTLGTPGAATYSGTIKIHEVQVRDGLNGASIVPRLPDGWGVYNTGTTCPIVGAPVLNIVNASHAGASMDYFSDATRQKLITPNYCQDLAITSLSHNELQNIGLSWYTRYAAFIAIVKARVGVSIAALTQNPQTTVAVGYREQARRRTDLIGFGKLLGIDVIDTYGDFIANPNWASEWMSDSAHPNTAGSLVIFDTVKTVFDKT